MRKSRIGLLAAVAAVVGLASTAGAQDAAGKAAPPKGWITAGANPYDYEMTTEPRGGRNGGACAYIKAKTSDVQGFGTLMQTIDAGEHKGKRLRLRGWAKSAGIGQWAGLWMRIDGPQGALLGFDNMQSRPIKGTTDWKQYDVVLDVPPEAITVNFGFLLSGPGQVWLDGVELQPVGTDVAVTQLAAAVKPKARPVNLNFEEH